MGSRGSALPARNRTTLICCTALSLVSVALLVACQGSDGSSTGTTAATTTTTTVAAGQVSGGGGSGNGGGGGGQVSPATTPPPTTTPPSVTPPATETTAPPTTISTDLSFGAYTVKQIQTLGGESISGTACDVRTPFVVDAATDKVAWQFLFTPTGATTKGTVTYAYTIPSAGESHDAKGTYLISAADPDGVRHLSLQVSDHVVFHGFDGKLPVSYKFDLVPLGTGCP